MGAQELMFKYMVIAFFGLVALAGMVLQRPWMVVFGLTAVVTARMVVPDQVPS